MESVRTFLLAADEGQFQIAADELGGCGRPCPNSLRHLRVALRFAAVRSGRGTQLSVDGQAFLPHARELVKAALRAVASVKPGNKALHVDVLNRRTALAAVNTAPLMRPSARLASIEADDCRQTYAPPVSSTIDTNSSPGLSTPWRVGPRPWRRASSICASDKAKRSNDS